MPPALSRRGPSRKRSTAAEFWPSTRRTSNSRMKRVTAIQKSSRTITMHCTRPPSHCRRACTNSVFCFFLLGVQPLLELVEDDHHLLAYGDALAPAQCSQRLFQTQVVRQGRTTLAQAVQQASFRFLGSRLDVDGNHVVGQARQQAGLHQRRFAAPRRPVDQAHGERVCPRPSPRCGSSRSGCCRAIPSRSRGPGKVRGRSRHRGHRTTASPFGTILTGWLVRGRRRWRGRDGADAGAWRWTAVARRPLPIVSVGFLDSCRGSARPGSAAGRRPCPWPSSIAPMPASRGLSGRCGPVPSGCCRRSAGAGGPRARRPVPAVPPAIPHGKAAGPPAIRRRPLPG